MGIDSWTSGKVCYNCLADSNNLLNNHYSSIFHRNPVECIEFLMLQPAFIEYMSYAPATEFNDPGKFISTEVKSSDWWWNEQVSELNFIIAVMILTASIATTAAWSSESPYILPFKTDTSYTLFGQQEGMARMYGSWKHQLDYWIKASESCKHPCFPCSCSSEISLQRT